jgi:hypothetical protein
LSIEKGTPKLPPEYLQKVMEVWKDCNWPTVEGEEYSSEDVVVALLMQNNMLLDKMCNLLLLATGMTDHDIPDDTPITMQDIEEAVGKNTVCGQCGRGVVPNKMGYCPKCGMDLRQQLARESMTIG